MTAEQSAEFDACRWCREPDSNCPNMRGECCCLPCFEYGPVVTHPRVLPPTTGDER